MKLESWSRSCAVACSPSSKSPTNTESVTLADLKRKVDTAIEAAIERNESPDEIPVTLQIETTGSGHDSICAHEDLELHYDGGAQATGCVLCAWISEENATAQTPPNSGTQDHE